MEMCGFDSKENSSEEEEDDEDSSILTTVKTSSKADNNKIITGNDFNNSSEEEESSILFTSSKFHMQWQREAINSVIQKAILEAEDKDVKVLGLGLLNQEEGLLNGNGIQLKLKVKHNAPKPTFWYQEFAFQNKTLPLHLFAFQNLTSDYYKQCMKSQLLVFHQSYSFRDLSGYFVQIDGWCPTFVALNHDANGVPFSSLGFFPDGLLLCQSFNDRGSFYTGNPATKEWRELHHPNYYQGFKSAIVLAFEPSVLKRNANYQITCAVRSFGVQLVCFELGDDTDFTGKGSFYMKGMAYWQTTSKQVVSAGIQS